MEDNKQNAVIPYSDSILTQIVKKGLEGHSKLFVLGTISPALSSLKETMKTLNFISRIKRIITNPIVNERPQGQLLKELREENITLRKNLMNDEAFLVNPLITI